MPRLPHEAGPKTTYTTSWTLRQALLCMMHISGISGLKPGKMSVYKFTCMNPDQTGGLKRVYRAAERTAGRLENIRDLMNAVGRKTRPELVSMDICFASDRSLDQLDFGKKLPIAELRKSKVALQKRDGMTPHIAHVVRRVLGN